MRSLKVAGRVPRSAATSSANGDDLLLRGRDAGPVGGERLLRRRRAVAARWLALLRGRLFAAAWRRRAWRSSAWPGSAWPPCASRWSSSWRWSSCAGLGRRPGGASRGLRRPGPRPPASGSPDLRDVERVVQLGAAPPAAQALRPPDQAASRTRGRGGRRSGDGSRRSRSRGSARTRTSGRTASASRRSRPGEHFGHVTPVDFGGSFWMYRQSGVPAAAHERPEAAELAAACGLPHSGQFSSSISGSGRSLPVEVADVLHAAVVLGEPGAPMKNPYRPEALHRRRRRHAPPRYSAGSPRRAPRRSARTSAPPCARARRANGV